MKPSPATDEHRVHLCHRLELRAWLGEHHDRVPGIWLVSWRQVLGRPRITRTDAIVELLAFGWAESNQRGLDAERTMFYAAPRRPHRSWTAADRDRVVDLETHGLMQEAGRQMVAAARASGSWQRLHRGDVVTVPPALAEAFEGTRGAWIHWECFPTAAKHRLVAWVEEPPTAEERAGRVEQVAASTGRGDLAPG